MAIVYFYQSYSGKPIPKVSFNTEEDLRKDHEGSTTPIVDLFHVRDKAGAKIAISVFRHWLSCVPKKETGLIHSLECVIRDLTELESRMAY